ncbi:MAG: T9SS type A sorting domain-containing protein, partial [Bacteroidota bacterium]|nr:T9SS type A sorting domain-containing protein [Bacteroidota bacterium]MDX5430672.1 T9SS type A sorting domain-containing protein [Bacteroidota bacterium]MDX5469419.1 T9SS type A sorting domain-containing protein [Bacteroidota bacterium]
ITNPINVGTGIQPFSVGISNQLNPAVYIGGSNSLFYRIKNAGNSKVGDEENLRAFVPSSLYSSFMNCIKVNPIDPSILYVAYSNYNSNPRVYRVDKADSDTPVFVNISGNLPVGMPVNWVEVDPASPDSVIFAGTDRGLYYTMDGGATWYQEEAIPNVVIDMLRVRMSDRRLFIYTHGRGVFTARITPYGKAIPAHNTVGLAPATLVQARVYPNPASSSFIVKWESNTNESKHIDIYSASGQRVYSGVHVSGASLEVNAWKNGLYFLQIEGAETQKLMVVHE